MEVNMRTNIMLDEDSHKVIGELPRKISASKLLRWLLKLIHTNDKEWTQLIKHDPEIREVQEWIRPKVIRALGINEEQRKKIMKIVGHDESNLEK
jgi:hypothetical protein